MCQKVLSQLLKENSLVSFGTRRRPKLKEKAFTKISIEVVCRSNVKGHAFGMDTWSAETYLLDLEFST